MKIFPTPKGRAGCDQLDGMTESVQAELEQMFWQTAKHNALSFSVGRTAGSAQLADQKIQLHAQKRECQAQAMFHAGRAMELAMHIVYARGADRIMAREYPGVDKKQMYEDRRSHNLASLYARIIDDLTGRKMDEALEQVYQEALHRGVHDICDGNDVVWSFSHVEDAPFSEIKTGGLIDGAEMTWDHSDESDPLGFMNHSLSEFEKMPHQTFSEFLGKADAAYYEADVTGSRRNLRWAHYSARDHEYGRPYVVVGTRFFARLVGGVIALSQQQWTWHPDFAQRWHERRRYIIGELVRVHLKQSYSEETELPEMKSVEEMVKLFEFPHQGQRFRDPKTYKQLHKRWPLPSKEPPDESAAS